MRPLGLMVLLAWFHPVFGAPPQQSLQITSAIIQQYEDGPALYKPQAVIPGETTYFSFQAAHFSVQNNHVKLSFIAQPLDFRNKQLALPVKGQIETTLSPEDKDWTPKLRGSFPLPPVLYGGEYRIALELTDELRDDPSSRSASHEISFLVSGPPPESAAQMAISHLNFYAREEEERPLAIAAFRIAEPIFARFMISGFDHTPEGRIDVTYGISLSGPNGRVLFQEPSAARDETAAFYPKPFVPGSASFTLKPGTPAGEYRLTITATDAIGNHQAQASSTFRLEAP